MRLKDIKIGTRQISGYLIIAVILVITGVVGMNGVSTIGNRLDGVIRTAPLVDAAMEMKINVARDMQMIMEFLASGSQRELDQIWQQHESFIEGFDIYADAILNGAQTEEGMIYAAEDEQLKKIVREADQFHNEEFQPRIANIYEIMKAKVKGEKTDEAFLSKLDTEADEIGEAMLEMIGGIEERAKTAINAAQKQATDRVENVSTILILATIVGFVLSIILGIFNTKAITTPFKEVVKFTERLAKGDFSSTMDQDRKDEMGDLILSLNQVVKSLSTIIKDINDNTISLESSSSELSGVASRIASSSESNVEKSNSVSAAAEEMNVNMTSVASAMEEATGNIDTVASASEEMNSSIDGIVKQVETAKESTHNAVNSADEVSQNVNKLGQDAEEISAVTEAIASISDKTNLLALNATIEAARAGEAGKGFAVVANEIKELANQTAEATTDISKKLKGIQNSTGIAVTGIEGITGIIKDINDVVASINDTMGQQSSAIQEISENINQASLGVKEINQNVSQTAEAAGQVASEIIIVNESASEVSNSTAQLNQSADDLNKMAIELKNKMEQFKI